MVSFATLKPYMNREIEDYGAYTSPDYETFQRKYRNFLKKICKENGFELVKFMGNHYEFSCFIKGNNKYMYLSISDVRYFSNEWWSSILIRTAKHERDFTGGANHYTPIDRLEKNIIGMLS